MASTSFTLRHRRLDSVDPDRGALMVPTFAIVSLVAHALLWLVLAALPSSGIALTLADTAIEFELAPLPEPEPASIPPSPEPEPELELEPEPQLPAPDVSRPPAASEPPPAVPEDVGVHSVTDGLAVDAVEATGDGGGVIAARPVVATQHGHVDGTGTGGAPPRPVIDHRRIAREWMNEVNGAVTRRAVRDYPRAARRSRLEGTVIVSIAVDRDGRITAVEVARGAGSDTLDRAAVAAVQAVGTLPPPPDIFNQRGRPLTMPISYRLR
jgi:protein TonB